MSVAAGILPAHVVGEDQDDVGLDASATLARSETKPRAAWKTRLIKLADVYDHFTPAGDQHSGRKKKAEQALTIATDTEPPIVLARFRI